jgi:serine/threonine-protein kinase RsbW
VPTGPAAKSDASRAEEDANERGSTIKVVAIPNLSLKLSNKAENVLLIRQALSGLAEAIELDAVELNDLSTVVTEACNNVVVHAYDGERGPLEVEIHASRPVLEVVVRDCGVGIKPRLRSADEASMGIGLPVIRALSHRAEFIDREPGTEVWMEFAPARAQTLEEPAQEQEAAFELYPADTHEPDADTMALTIAPSALARSVIPRVLAGLAARAQFSTDRIAETQLLADTLITRTDGSIGAGRLSVSVGVSPRMLDLQLGPLQPGQADELLNDELDGRGLGGMLERLADGYRVAPAAIGGSDVLALQLTARR